MSNVNVPQPLPCLFFCFSPDRVLWEIYVTIKKLQSTKAQWSSKCFWCKVVRKLCTVVHRRFYQQADEAIAKGPHQIEPLQGPPNKQPHHGKYHPKYFKGGISLFCFRAPKCVQPLLSSSKHQSVLRLCVWMSHSRFLRLDLGHGGGDFILAHCAARGTPFYLWFKTHY